jgi:hypothetical protein
VYDDDEDELLFWDASCTKSVASTRAKRASQRLPNPSMGFTGIAQGWAAPPGDDDDDGDDNDDDEEVSVT